MPDLSVYAQAKLLDKILTETQVELEGTHLRIVGDYGLTEDEAAIVKMLAPDRPEGELGVGRIVENRERPPMVIE